MTAYLLDVNILVALSWPEHTHHEVVRSWFARHRSKGWATCPLVQSGFVRVISNPAFSAKCVSVSEAIQGLRASLADETHHFWPDSISFPEAVRLIKGPIRGHQQVADAYLVGLAIHHRGKLATLDRGIVSSEAVEYVL